MSDARTYQIAVGAGRRAQTITTIIHTGDTTMTTTTPRARITSDAGYPNRCTLRTTDDFGQPVERHFFAPMGGGYVREDWSNPRQVCEHLAGRGSTLVWNPDHDETLADLIRRERAAGLRADRAMWRRMGY